MYTCSAKGYKVFELFNSKNEVVGYKVVLDCGFIDRLLFGEKSKFFYNKRNMDEYLENIVAGSRVIADEKLRGD